MEPATHSRVFRMGEGDWVCSNSQCGNINFARRSHCNRCNEKKEPDNKLKMGHEIGKALAEKSKGLFSAEDWQCTKCGNVNWARRQQCNVCNAPKFAEVEERTGYGGGYNERGVVEYIKRDSDDEYDEFGRRKKKTSNVDKEEKHRVEEDNEVEEAEREEDEEEEDGDDDDDDDEEEGDLSKYDLTDWGDMATTNENGQDESPSSLQANRDRVARATNLEKRQSDGKRSRSRSRSPH